MKMNNCFGGVSGDSQVRRTIVKADYTRVQAEDTVVHEHFLDLSVNERLMARLVCTPSCLPELVMGRLLTEGIITSAEEVESVYICENGSAARVFLREDISLKEAAPLVPTCCTGNQVLLRRQGTEAKASVREAAGDCPPEWIFALANRFARDSELHQRTKGTHSCYLGVKGECVFAAEDIGRHNAMDKCIGHMLLQSINPMDCILFTTGRVPTDMVQKAAASGIPVLASKAVPTDAAVALAAQEGLTLICKAWPDQYEIYSPSAC